MRASYIQGNLEAVELLGPDASARIHTLVGTELEKTIRTATRVDWLPLDVDVRLTHVVAEVVGLEKLKEWARNAFLHSVEGPLLRPILRAAVSLFGLTPLSLLRHTPVAWKQIYTDCGEVRVEQVDPQHLRIHVDGVPELMTRDRIYHEGTCGTLSAALHLSRVNGSVTLEIVSPHSIVFDVRWEKLSG